MKIEKIMETYEVSDDSENISINGNYTILNNNLNYVTLIANINSTDSLNKEKINIGNLEFKAHIGKPSISVTDSDAYMPLMNVFEQIKKNVNFL